MNICTFIGNLGQDNDLKFTQTGKAVLQNNLAVKANYGDGTNWIPFKIWNKPAEATANYTQKGSKVAVTGEMQQETWESQDGQKRSKLVLNVSKIVFLDGKKASSNQEDFGNTDIDLDDFQAIDEEDGVPF